MISTNLLLGTLVALSAAFVLGHLYNVIRLRGDSAKASKETMSMFPGLTAGAATAGLVIVTDAVLILAGVIISVPDILITSMIGLLGYLTIDGIVSLTPETYGMLVIVGAAVLGVIR